MRTIEEVDKAINTLLSAGDKRTLEPKNYKNNVKQLDFLRRVKTYLISRPSEDSVRRQLEIARAEV